MIPFSQCRLYTFIDTAYLAGRSPPDVARRLCEGGSDLIQLRAKDRSPDEIESMARAILPVTRAAGVRLVINDHPRLAADVGAEACHLGQEDFFDAGHAHVDQVRSGDSRLLIGLSTHGPEQAKRAVAAGADYVAVGPVYATGTKPSAAPVTLEYVRWAAGHIQIPWFAIGGINLDNLGDVLGAGATRVCVVSAILNAPDVTKACRAFKERLTSPRFYKD